MSKAKADLSRASHELADLIGLDALLKLSRYRGGRWLHIPVKVNANHPLAQAIGLDAARKLVAHHKGENLRPPMCTRALRELRDREIHRRHYELGESLDSLAGYYGLHQSTICKALKRAGEMY